MWGARSSIGFRAAALLMLLVCGSSWAAAGGALLLDDQRKLDPGKLSRFLAEVEPYIRGWPPRFRDAEHQKQLTGQVTQAVSEIDALGIGNIPDAAQLTYVAQILAMGHNLDMPTAGKARVAFEAVLAKNPESRRANYLLGMMLISTKSHHFESLPYLEKAYALGEMDALFSIGLLQLEQGEKEKGLESLERYSRARPELEHPRRVIQAVKDGKLTFKRSP